MFLATKNAANISVRKGQIDGITSLKQLVEDISGQVALNSYNIKQIVEASGKANALTSPLTRICHQHNFEIFVSYPDI